MLQSRVWVKRWLVRYSSSKYRIIRQSKALIIHCLYFHGYCGHDRWSFGCPRITLSLDFWHDLHLLWSRSLVLGSLAVIWTSINGTCYDLDRLFWMVLLRFVLHPWDFIWFGSLVFGQFCYYLDFIHGIYKTYKDTFTNLLVLRTMLLFNHQNHN
jgi:hypothetical protein